MISVQAIPYAADRLNGIGASRLIQLTPKVGDVNVDQRRLNIALVGPDVVEDLVSRERLTGMADEELEQRPLGLGEIEWVLPTSCRVGVEVEHQVANAKLVGVACGGHVPPA
jgi:hypothetical protein